ncbi:MAG: hypothetical protein IKU61_01000 [Clostridia bacterium]|nr:hypothetical protein [Clostridia bacterium]
MRKFLFVLLAFPIFCLPIFSAVPVTPLSTSGAKLVYENTFDNKDSISDFTQYRDTWTVVDGKLRFTGLEAGNTNSFIIYTGNKEITELSDYVAEVDMFNSRGASGLIARADLENVSDAGHGHGGYLTMISTSGNSAVMRTPNRAGSAVETFITSKQLLHHNTNVHIKTVVRGNIISTTLTDIDTGMTLWGWTQKHNTWKKGSVGLFAYGKVTSGLDCRDVAFDNLKVYTLPSLEETSDFDIVSGGFAQLGEAARLDSTEDTSVAVYNKSQQIGTVSADVFTPASGKVGLVFAKDENSYYKLAYSSDLYIHLIKVIDGKETVLKKTEYKHGTTVFGIGDLRAVYDGSTIYGYFLDKCLIKYTDSSPLTGNGVGVFADKANATILNFTVSDKTTPDKADIIIWGHSHMGRWYHVHEILGKYGKVMNVGIGATSTEFWFTIADELTTYGADTVIVMTGSNDMAIRKNTDTLKYLSKTLDIMRASNPRLKVILITEWYQPSRYEQYREMVLDLNRLWTEYAAENSSWITLVDGFSIGTDENGVFNGLLADGSINYDVFADTQHLNILSYDKLNARVLEALEKVFLSYDVDNDNKVTVNDGICALKMNKYNDVGRFNAFDADNDGKISFSDVLKFFKKIFK